MAQFFHLDKDDFPHEPGAEVPMMRPQPEQLPMLNAEKLKYWKPRFSTEGFSFFGYRILWITNWPPKELTPQDQVAIEREIIFEDVREVEFPERPSRLQSVYGFRTLGDAHRYRSGSKHPEWKLWMVESDNYFIGDINLYNNADPQDFYAIARRYWSGEKSSDVLEEVLMKLPVKIVGEVEE